MSALPAIQRSMDAAGFDAETAGERIFVAEMGDKVVGFVSLSEGETFVHHLYVVPEYQRKGIGTALLRHVERFVNGSLSLKCQTANAGALAFYDRYGFVESDERGDDRLGPWVRLVLPEPSRHASSGQSA